MRKPIFVRPLTKLEQQQLEACRHSGNAFALRRSQIRLSCAHGQRAPAIAESIGYDDEAVRDVIRAFNAKGLAALTPGSRRPHHTRAAFTPAAAEQLRELLHKSPRTLGKPTS